MRRYLLLLCSVALSTSTVLFGQEHANNAIGFAPNKSFEIGDVDHINGFNGNLVLTIPIGPRYPVNGSLSYGLTLVYNSTIWEFQKRIQCNSDGESCVEYIKPIPMRRSNAGMGWVLSLGQLFLKYSLQADGADERTFYMGPDGGLHSFYPAAVAGISYTRDGTHLRLKDLTTLSTGTGYSVEFPDGTANAFDKDGRLTQISDSFGNWVKVAHASTAPNTPDVWTITDSQNANRTQTVNFESAADPFLQVVSSVVLTAADNQTATYAFGHQSTSIQPACAHSPWQDPEVQGYAAPLLTSLTLPDGTTYQAHYLQPVPPTPPTYPPTCDDMSGDLDSLTLPTGGKLSYTYRRYAFPGSSDSKPYRQASTGVATRTMTDTDNTTATWTHSSNLSNASLTSTPLFVQFVHTITDPNNNVETQHFSVFSDTDATYRDWSICDYGLPFARSFSYNNGSAAVEVNNSDPTGSGGWLSTETRDSSGTLLRQTFVKYEHDTDLTCDEVQVSQNLNQRLQRQRTIYPSDANHYTGVSYSDYDGLGHYRKATTDGNFDSGNTRTTYTAYNRNASSTDCQDQTPTTATTPGTSAAWLLGRYSCQSADEGTAKEYTETVFDDSNGLLKARRARRTGSSQGVADLLTTFSYDTSGNLTAEKYFGGDTQATLATGNLSTLTAPAIPTYELDHTYESGTRKTSKYAGVTWYLLNRSTIDAATGLTKISTDSLGHTTAYEYDESGRLLWTKPQGAGWTEHVYNNYGATRANAWTRSRGVNTKTGTIYAWTTAVVDGFGRLSQESVMTPGCTSPCKNRNTTYNLTTNQRTVSEWGSSTNKTTVAYDVLGRTSRITLPDNHVTTFVYHSARQLDRTVKIAGVSGEVDRTTTEVYDRQGRLTSVTEPAGAPASYTYDVGNRLHQVTMTSGGTTQTRTFTYDDAGLLQSEAHPEKGLVSLYRYDARGHATRKNDAGVILKYTYDAAERLTGITDNSDNPLKTFGFDETGCAGRLCRATRYNHSGPASELADTIPIEHVYAYGADGRVSQRVTNCPLAPNSNYTPSFSQSWLYDPLGHVSDTTYPRCSTPSDCGTAPARTVHNTYDSGFLTGVGAYATLSYSTGLRLKRVAHGNGIYDLEDSDVMQRPADIYSTLGNPDSSPPRKWDSGSYSYDGAGNIKAIGSNQYTYDGANRLVHSTTSNLPDGTGSLVTEDFQYDGFGNLDLGGAANPSTNQLQGSPLAGGDCQLGPIDVVQYDNRGNLTCWRNNTYTYDAFNQISHYRSADWSLEWDYLYDADDERVVINRISPTLGLIRFTLRGLDGKVLSEIDWESLPPPNNHFVVADYIYRDGQLLAAEVQPPGGSATTEHFSLDHLGTPRLITNASGVKTAYHAYFPYGEEATSPLNQDPEHMKFTGHERDIGDALVNQFDPAPLDYMHARHRSPLTGRFMSVDRLRGSPRRPQTWNRYVYANNRPITLVDPDGRFATPWHMLLTYWASRAHGASIGQSVARSVAVALVDINTQGTNAAEANVHAMLAPGQSPEEGAEAVAEGIEFSVRNGFIARAMHTVQDQAVPLHYLEVWNGDTSRAHRKGDWFPSLDTLATGYYNALLFHSETVTVGDGAGNVIETWTTWHQDGSALSPISDAEFNANLTASEAQGFGNAYVFGELGGYTRVCAEGICIGWP